MAYQKKKAPTTTKRERPERKPKADYVEMEGKVTDVLPGGKFIVTLPNTHTVEAHVSGKMRMNHIRILPGDTVVLEISVYDLTHGRIIWR